MKSTIQPFVIRYVIGELAKFTPAHGICFADYDVAQSHARKHKLAVLSLRLCQNKNPNACKELTLVTTMEGAK